MIVDLSKDLSDYPLLDFNAAFIKKFPRGRTPFMTFKGLRLFLITGSVHYDLLLQSVPIPPKAEWIYVVDLYQTLEDTLYENLLGKPEYRNLTVTNTNTTKALDTIWLEVVRKAIKRL